jgi:hypothetical protein
MARQIIVDVIGDSSKFNKATNDAIATAGKLENGLRGSAVAGAVAGVTMSVVSKAIDLVTNAFSGASEAAKEDTLSQDRLKLAYDNTGRAQALSIAQIEEAIRANQRKGVSDEAQRAGIADFLDKTKSATEALKLNTATIELAAAKAIPYADAENIIKSAAAGKTAALQKAGVEIKKGADITQIATAVNAKFSGSLDRMAETESGKLAISNQKLNEAMESVGRVINTLAIVVVPAVVGAFSDFVTLATDNVGPAIELISNNMLLFGPIGIGIAAVILSTVIPAFVSMAVAAAAAAAAAAIALAPFVALGAIVAGGAFLIGQGMDLISGKTEDMASRVTASIGRVRDDVYTPTAQAAADIGKIGTSARSAATKVEDSMNSIVAAIRGARSALLSAASDAADAIYGPQIVAAELAQTKRAEADERAIIADKKSTAAQIADARLRLLELSKTQVEQEAALAGYGNTSAAAVLTHQLKVLKAVKGATLEQKTEIGILETALAKLRHAYDLVAAAATRIGDAKAVLAYILAHPGGLKGFASGGHYQAGEPRIVGERGPELDVPDSGGTIMPKWGVGGGTVVNISISEGAFIDGPSIDRLVNMLTLRMRHASGI